MKFVAYPKESNRVEFQISTLVVTNKIITLFLKDGGQKKILIDDLNAYKVLEDDI